MLKNLFFVFLRKNCFIKKNQVFLRKVGFSEAWAPKTNFFLGKSWFFTKINKPWIVKTNFTLGKTCFFKSLCS